MDPVSFAISYSIIALRHRSRSLDSESPRIKKPLPAEFGFYSININSHLVTVRR
jgi:hypothetical protein